MYDYLEFASSVQPTVQRVDGTPTLERHELGNNLVENEYFYNQNNTDGGIYSGEGRNTGWKFLSPVFISNVDYKQGFNFQYFLPNPPYSNTTSLVDTPADWDDIPLKLKRGLKMFGLGNVFGLVLNQNSGRSFSEVPIVGMTNKTIDSNTAWRDADTWAKYDCCQDITTTADSVTFGAWVRCDPNDALRALNMGGLYLYQDTESNPTGQRTVFVNSMVVKRAANTPNLKTGGSSSFPITSPYSQGHYNWSGLRDNTTDIGTIANNLKYRWNDYLTVEGIDYYEAEDMATWTRIEKTVSLQGASGSLRRIGLAMFFAENMSYLNNDGELTGSIDFYSPYVIPNTVETETALSLTYSTSGLGGVPADFSGLPQGIGDTGYTNTTEKIEFYVTIDSGKEIVRTFATGVGKIAPKDVLLGTRIAPLGGRYELSDGTTVKFEPPQPSGLGWDGQLGGPGTFAVDLYVAKGTTGTLNLNFQTAAE